jgi:TPR repeat protein
MALLGIDFGTTKTMAAYWDDATKSPKLVRLGNGRDFIPTTVHIDSKGQFSFGEDADDQRATDSGGYLRRIKRYLGMNHPHVLNGNKLMTVEIIARFLKEIIEKAENEALYAKVDHLVVTVPAAYGPTKRADLEAAIKLTGIQDFELLDEPVSAALAWLKINGGLGKTVMVFDWGGGTLDIAVLERYGEGYRAHPGLIGGDENLGGEDIDDRLIDGMDSILAQWGKKPYQERSGRECSLISKRVRERKLEHTRKDVVTWSFILEDMEDPYSWKWTRAEFNQWIAADVNRAVQLASAQFSAARAMGVVIDQVILIGGSSNIPLVAERLHEVLQIDPLKWHQSIEAVAYGAAIQAHLNSPVNETAKRFINQQKIVHRDTGYFLEELCTVMWRNNNIGNVSAYNLCQPLSTIQKTDSPDDVSDKIHDGLSTFSKIGFDDFVAKFSTELPTIFANMVSCQADSYIKRYPYLSEFKAGFAVPESQVVEIKTSLHAGLNSLRDVYDRMKAFHAQLQDFLPRYRSTVNSVHISAIQMGDFDCVSRVVWGGWQAMPENEFLNNYIYALHALAKSGSDFSEKGETILKNQSPRILGMWNGTFTSLEKVYRKMALMGLDLEAVDNSQEKVSSETAVMSMNVFHSLRQRSEISKQALNNIAKDFRRVGVPILDVTTTVLGSEADVQKCRAKATNGDVEAAYQLGCYYFEGDRVAQDYREAILWFRKAGDRNFGDALFQLGWIYEHGLGISQDYHEAMAWFLKAADQGIDRAQCAIGFMYANGWGVPQDNAMAMNWYQKAASQGFFMAQNNIGYMHLHGLGVPSDTREALKWFELAAGQGCADAHCSIGSIYQHGQGVAKDYTMALARYRMAADLGDVLAKSSIGAMYEGGLGVSQNITEATEWYKKAAAQEDPYAIAALKRLASAAEKKSEPPHSQKTHTPIIQRSPAAIPRPTGSNNQSSQPVPNNTADTVYCPKCKRHVHTTRNYGAALAIGGGAAVLATLVGMPWLAGGAVAGVRHSLTRRCPTCESAI